MRKNLKLTADEKEDNKKLLALQAKVAKRDAERAAIGTGRIIKSVARHAYRGFQRVRKKGSELYREQKARAAKK